MGFMQSYKRLDALCRDINGIGVTGYIEDMERSGNGNRYISGWSTDYHQLKHYRHLRNQIAHEVDATEEAMCSEEDVIWIEEFHQRILRQTDPLTILYKVSLLHKSEHISQKSSFTVTARPSNPIPTPGKSENAKSNRTVLIIGVIILVLGLVLYWYYF